jgi:diacylglycerol kinase family enzyme
MSPESSQPSGKERILVIYNKRSGPYRFRDHKRLISSFFTNRKIDFEMIDFTNYDPENRPRELLSALQKKNFTRLMVAGGDGTLEAVVRLIYFQNLDIPLFFYPLGSTNFYASILNTKKGYSGLLQLLNSKPVKKNIGLVNGNRIFLIAISFGRLSKILHYADYYHKHVIGFPAYIFSFLRLSFRFPKRKMTLSWGNISKRMRANSALITLDHVSKKFFGASPDERVGNLNAYVFMNRSIFGLIPSFMSTLKGRSSKNVNIFTADHFSVELKRKNEINIDGDPLKNKGGEYSIKVAPRPVTFLS